MKDNGAVHATGTRVFGAHRANATLSGYPLLYLTGRPLRRTWSILSETAVIGGSSLRLSHSATAMGWRVGDRITIATTARSSQGEGVAYFLKSISADGITITLSSDEALTTTASFNQVNTLSEKQVVSVY